MGRKGKQADWLKGRSCRAPGGLLCTGWWRRRKHIFPRVARNGFCEPYALGVSGGVLSLNPSTASGDSRGKTCDIVSPEIKGNQMRKKVATLNWRGLPRNK